MKAQVRSVLLAVLLTSGIGCSVPDVTVKLASDVGGNNSIGGTSSIMTATISSGGASSSGGVATTGGTMSTGGKTSAGGALSGGYAATGGYVATGGVATGGVFATGGIVATGGTASGAGGTSADASTCGFTQHCGPIDFHCNDGTCIPPSSRCDGVSQCTYGEDEVSCGYETLSCYRCVWNNCSAESQACTNSSTCSTEFIAMQSCANVRQQGIWPSQTSPEPYSASQVAGCASLVTSQNLSVHTEARNLVNCILQAPGNCPAECFDSTVQDPQLATAQGWFGGDSTIHTDDPMGFQGGWFAYTDGYSCPDIDAVTAVNPCCGGKCCLHGNTFVDSSFVKWGCGLGFNFQSTGSTTDVPNQYAGPADGLLVEVSGNLGGLTLRIEYTQSGAVSLTTPPFVEITKPNLYAIDFLSVSYPSWCTTSNCTGVSGDPVLAKPFGVHFEIAGGSVAAPYNFCIESVRPYSAGGNWTCSQSDYGTSDGCDCGCGIPDPDCAGSGCTQSSCSATGCNRCYNSLETAQTCN